MVCSNSSTKEPALCRLLWRQEKLWVVPPSARNQHVALPALAQPEWFQACLERSKATTVCIDSALGPEVISNWAQACQIAQKPWYLRIPASPHRPAKQKPLAWGVKRLCDYIVALGLLVVCGPLFLTLAGIIRSQSSGPVFATEWRVGKRGRMFRMFKFRTVVDDGSALDTNIGIKAPEYKPVPTMVGRWLKQNHLDELPLLFNVLRGETSLVGPHAWAIYETLVLPPELRTELHTLPGLTGTFQRFCHFPSTNSKGVLLQDVRALGQWSLWHDFKQLAAATANFGRNRLR